MSTRAIKSDLAVPDRVWLFSFVEFQTHPLSRPADQLHHLLEREILGIKVVDADVPVFSSGGETPPIPARSSKISWFATKPTCWGRANLSPQSSPFVRPNRPSVSVVCNRMCQDSRVAHDRIDWAEVPLDAADLVLENLVEEDTLKLSGPSRSRRHLFGRLSSPQHNLQIADKIRSSSTSTSTAA